MKRANLEVRDRAKAAGIQLWAVADRMGVSESTLTRMLRKELPPAEKGKLISFINSLSAKEGGPNA